MGQGGARGISEKGNTEEVNQWEFQGKRQDKVLRQSSYAAVMCIREGTLRQVLVFCKNPSGASEAPDANSVVVDEGLYWDQSCCFFLVVFSLYFFSITCPIPVSFWVSSRYVSLLTTISCYACLIGQQLILFSCWLFISLAALFLLPCQVSS